MLPRRRVGGKVCRSGWVLVVVFDQRSKPPPAAARRAPLLMVRGCRCCQQTGAGAAAVHEAVDFG